MMPFKIPVIPQGKSQKYVFNKNVNVVKWQDLTILTVIGQGQFGEVSKVRYKDKNLVAKRLLSQNEYDRKCYMKEVNIMSELSHPNIMGVKGVCPDKCAILMDCMAFDFTLFGGDQCVHCLSDFMNYVDRHNVIDEFNFFPQIAITVAKALEYLHEKGVAHRDLKPQNILVSNQHYATCNEEEFAQRFETNPIDIKLCDFGESRSQQHHTNTYLETRTRVLGRGTPAYMAPEMGMDSKILPWGATLEDLRRADVWSLGLTLFALTNPSLKHPFDINMREAKTAAENGQPKKKWADILEDGPKPDTKYMARQATSWFPVYKAYEMICIEPTCPSRRPQLCRVIQQLEMSEEPHIVDKCAMSCSQESALEKADASLAKEVANSACVNVAPYTRPKNDGSNACAFLSMMIADQVLTHPKSLHILAKESSKVIQNGPLAFNLHRCKETYYSVEEANKVLQRQLLLRHVYELTEEIVSDKGVFTPTGRSELMQCISNLKQRAIYTCAPYVFTVWKVDDGYVLLDTHPVITSLGGDTNGLVVKFSSPLHTCMWIWKRLYHSGVSANTPQSLCALEEKQRKFKEIPVSTTKEDDGKSTANQEGMLGINNKSRGITGYYSKTEIPVSTSKEDDGKSTANQEGMLGINNKSRSITGYYSKNEIPVSTTKEDDGKSTANQEGMLGINNKSRSITGYDSKTEIPVSTTKEDDGKSTANQEGMLGINNKSANKVFNDSFQAQINQQNEQKKKKKKKKKQKKKSPVKSGIQPNSVDCGNRKTDHVEIINGVPVYNASSRVLTMQEIIDICVSNNISEEKICTQVPLRVKENATFVIDLEKVDLRDVTVDDAGIYERHSSPSQRVWVFERDTDSAEEDEIKLNRAYTLRKSKAPEEADEFVVRRQYSWQSTGLKRTIIKVLHEKKLLRYAIIQYKIDSKYMDNVPSSHGNSHSYDERYYRTKPSVLEQINKMAKDNSPKDIVANIQMKAGGSYNLKSPSEIPRDRRQVYNVLQKVPNRLKSRNTGKQKTPELYKLQSKMNTSKFVRDVSLHASKEHHTCTFPNTFASTNTQLHWIKTFCSGKHPKAQVGIDMTYNVGPYFLTAMSFAHPMFVTKGTTRHPTIFLGMTTSCSRTTSDYHYLAANLSREGVSSLTYGTDGEMALEKGLETMYPIDGLNAETNIHLRCFEHIKVDLKMQMKKLGIDEDKQHQIIRKILGTEFEGERTFGLVDCSESEFDEKLQSLELPKELIEWMKSEKGRVRPLTETLKKCALKSVRTAAGLGDPPNQYTTQRCESMNNVIKEVAQRKQVDQVYIHELIEEKIVDAQTEELNKAIFGMGEYRLDTEYKHLQVDQLKWFQMDHHQRQAYAEKVLLYKDPCRILALEVPEELEIPTISKKELGVMWKKTSLLINKENAHLLQNGCYCVTDTSKSYVVEQSSSLGYTCHCPTFQVNKLLCEHIVFVCVKVGNLDSFLEKISKKSKKPVQIMWENLPKGKGLKPGQKRRGKNNVERAPIVKVRHIECTKAEEDDDGSSMNSKISHSSVDEINIALPKAAVYDKYYQSDEMFHIVFACDYSKATSCISCGNAIPKNAKVVFIPYDIVFMHRERYQYPIKDDKGKVLKMVLTRKKVAERFYCLKKECVLNRHPYFWIGRIRVSDDIKARLHGSHLQMLKNTLQGYVP